MLIDGHEGANCLFTVDQRQCADGHWFVDHTSSGAALELSFEPITTCQAASHSFRGLVRAHSDAQLNRFDLAPHGRQALCAVLGAG